MSADPGNRNRLTNLIRVQIKSSGSLEHGTPVVHDCKLLLGFQLAVRGHYREVCTINRPVTTAVVAEFAGSRINAEPGRRLTQAVGNRIPRVWIIGASPGNRNRITNLINLIRVQIKSSAPLELRTLVVHDCKLLHGFQLTVPDPHPEDRTISQPACRTTVAEFAGSRINAEPGRRIMQTVENRIPRVWIIGADPGNRNRITNLIRVQINIYMKRRVIHHLYLSFWLP